VCILFFRGRGRRLLSLREGASASFVLSSSIPGIAVVPSRLAIFPHLPKKSSSLEISSKASGPAAVPKAMNNYHRLWVIIFSKVSSFSLLHAWHSHIDNTWVSNELLDARFFSCSVAAAFVSAAVALFAIFITSLAFLAVEAATLMLAFLHVVIKPRQVQLLPLLLLLELLDLRTIEGLPFGLTQDSSSSTSRISIKGCRMALSCSAATAFQDEVDSTCTPAAFDGKY